MSNTLKSIVIAVLLLAALIILLITFTNNEYPDLNPVQENGGTVITPPEDEPDNNNKEDEPGNFIDDPDDHVFYKGRLELPVLGATGWVAARLTLRAEARATSSRLMDLVPGEVFTIFDEVDNWWYVILPNEVSGWVEINKCFINLPDVIPSIVYNISNAVSSEFRSSGFDLPGITQNSLYTAYSHNGRLERGEFIVPGTYNLATALFAIQQLALNNGETLIIYEVFRPIEAQRAVAAALNRMLNRNDSEYNEVASRAIRDSQWSVGSFISQGRSNHQLGAAIDVTIGIVEEIEFIQTGEYSHRRIKYYNRVDEPSPMHELSPKAVLPKANTPEGAGIDERIWRMKSYFETTGFTALPSEWWHFNHTTSVSNGISQNITGNFFTPLVYSIPPFS
ncbi:MAG: hypothetical protein LBD23_02805 [Oscillospiraceae bacterium]|jgi:D-alanyl-D-alanine dipeptidase|nr:hypothetical protein [Oscillospiraceae bacterium]